VLALTADHGVCPLPEVAHSQGKDAGRVPAPEKKAEEFLEATFGNNEGMARWVEATFHPWVYLNRDLIRRRGLKTADVEEALAGWLKKQPGVHTAYTRTQLLQGVPQEDTVGQRVRRSFQSERSGDVIVIVKPYYLVSSEFSTGTGHSTPYAYDTHVPLLVYGPGIRTGPRPDGGTPKAVAVILAPPLR